jgi:hypothetical protein
MLGLSIKMPVAAIYFLSAGLYFFDKVFDYRQVSCAAAKDSAGQKQQSTRILATVDLLHGYHFSCSHYVYCRRIYIIKTTTI